MDSPISTYVMVAVFCIFMLLLLQYSKIQKRMQIAQQRYQEAQRTKRVQRMLDRVESHHSDDIQFENDVPVAIGSARRNTSGAAFALESSQPMDPSENNEIANAKRKPHPATKSVQTTAIQIDSLDDSPAHLYASGMEQ